MAPSLGSMNLLKQLTEKETLNSLDYQFIIKGCNLVTAQRKSCTEQGMGKGVELPCLLQPSVSPNLYLFTNPELSKPHPSGFCFC